MTQELCRRVVSTQHPLAACSSCRPRPPRHSRGRLRGGTRGRTRVRIWRKALRDVEVSGTELLLRDTLPCRGFEYVEALFRSAHGPTSRMPRPSTRGKDPVGFALLETRLPVQPPPPLPPPRWCTRRPCGGRFHSRTGCPGQGRPRSLAEPLPAQRRNLYGPPCFGPMGLKEAPILIVDVSSRADRSVAERHCLRPAPPSGVEETRILLRCIPAP